MNIGLISVQHAFSFGHATINNYLAVQLEIYERERMLSDARLPVNVSTVTFNPLTPTSDQDRISPYNINTTSSRQVIRIKKNIN